MDGARARRAGRWRAARGLAVACLILASGACASPPAIPRWDPAAFRDLDTLEFLTIGPEEGPHWSTVWLVVLDGEVYVRLGTRAAERMRQNATNPHLTVRIGGREYEHVRAEETATMADRVAAAMAEKYWSDALIRYVPHPLTMRLVPDPGAGER
jgi:hypothetical protein